MRTQFQNLSRAALVAAWMLTPAFTDAGMGRTDPIDGTRALFRQVPAFNPAAMSLAYEATAERALLARFDRPSDQHEIAVVSIAVQTPERALLGR